MTDLGHRKEILVAKIIRSLKCDHTWILNAAQSNHTEDAEGKDVIVYTKQGEFYIQIKSSLKKAEDFVQDKKYRKRYKKMYVVTHHDKEKTTCHTMPAPNENAYPFIIVLVIFQKQKGYQNQNVDIMKAIEDISLVLKKIKITLNIIKQHIDELEQ
ncbi:MAG: hypothetical protein HYT28_01375 [Parcubacteria group bacterium]|nr:hypothetical protein [Parcubacteria group bacterium]